MPLLFVAVWACLASLPVLPAEAREMGGHDVPDTVEAGGRTLVLNGAGIRRKLLFNVYVAALYLEARNEDPAAILGAEQAWQVTMHFMRNISHHQVLDAFTEAFEHNSPGQLPLLHDDLEKFHSVMEDLKKGQDLVLRFSPGEGTTLEAPSGKRVTVPGRAFAEAILRTWLGDRPSDPSLKERMLGR